MSVYEAAEQIAKRLNKKFLPLRLRWKGGKFVMDTDGEKDVMEIINNPTEYFVLCDIRLSTVAPEI